MVGAGILLAGQDRTPEASESPWLEDVVVTGSLPRTRDVAERFVDTVGAAPTARKLARWRDSVCVSVVNVKATTAHALADHIATVAAGYGLYPGGPGCSPDVIVFVTDDGDATARGLVRSRSSLFRVGGASSVQLGSAALARFQSSNKPIRWWHISVPVNAETGLATVRFPGDPPYPVDNGISRPSDVMGGANVLGSRLLDQTDDELRRVFIIVEADAVAGFSGQALGDYLAMVALAQIDAERSFSSFDSVLNLFDRPDLAGFSDWDRAYLGALYDPAARTAGSGAQSDRMAASMIDRLSATAD
ncbi:hypothetical protein ACETK8_14170 [Brevundimonas staleyi]